MTDLIHIATLTTAAEGTVATVTDLQIGPYNEDLLLYAASPASGLVSVFAVPQAGRATDLGQVPLPPSEPGWAAPVVPVTLDDNGDGHGYVLSLSAAEDALLLSTADVSGAPADLVASLGATDGLGLGTPVHLEQVSLGGAIYAVVGASGSSSLTVVEVTGEGTLRPTDHIIDDLTTRFDNVVSLTSVTAGERAFVLAGGADDGLSLFELLPGGRLILRDTVVDDVGLSLDNPLALAATAQGQVMQVFAGSETEPGISQFSATLGVPGTVGIAGPQDAGLTGSAGDDILMGGRGQDMLSGGAGRDTLSDGAGADTLTGGAGQDLFVLAADGIEDRILDFDPAQDSLDLSGWIGLRSAAQLSVAATQTGARITYGDETLVLQSGDGQPLSVSAVLQASEIPLTRVFHQPTAPQEVIEGTEGADTLEGNGLDNTLRGFGGDDLLRGADGADMLNGGGGADRLEGGAGQDTASYSDATQGVLADLGFAHLNRAEAAGDSYASIENILGSAWRDDLRGDGEANTIHLGTGDDVAHGRQGDDRLFGETGDDILLGGPGADLLDGGAGIDRAAYYTAGRSLTADLVEPWRNTGEAAGDTYLSIEHLQGGRQADDLRGTDGANSIWGIEGNDVIAGRGGNDILLGGPGADWLDGGAGLDRAAYYSAPAGLTADLAASSANTGDAAGDSYTGIEHLQGSEYGDDLRGDQAANTIWGNGGDDMIQGRAGDDFLFGREGDDWLDGGVGNDLLRGEEGADSFVFRANSGRDLILDFSVEEDSLVLARDIWGGIAPDLETLADSTFTFSDGIYFGFAPGVEVLLLGQTDLAGVLETMEFI